MAPYAAEVFSVERNYPLVPPVVPGIGGVGRVVHVGSDATRLRPGDLVWCDSTVRSRDDVLTPDITLQGWSSRGEGGARLARYLHDGSFAGLMRVPTENVFPLPAAAGDDPARWAALGVHVIPYGGLLDGGLAAGETLLVSGATGNLGSSAVAVALAMGAGRVVAPGRNQAALDLLADRFGPLVRPVPLTGDEAGDRAAMSAAADGPIDMVIDLLPPSAPSSAAADSFPHGLRTGQVPLWSEHRIRRRPCSRPENPRTGNHVRGIVRGHRVVSLTPLGRPAVSGRYVVNQIAGRLGRGRVRPELQCR